MKWHGRHLLLNESHCAEAIGDSQADICRDVLIAAPGQGALDDGHARSDDEGLPHEGATPAQRLEQLLQLCLHCVPLVPAAPPRSLSRRSYQCTATSSEAHLARLTDEGSIHGAPLVVAKEYSSAV